MKPILIRFPKDMQRWLRKNAKQGEIATLVRYAVAKLMAENKEKSNDSF